MQQRSDEDLAVSSNLSLKARRFLGIDNSNNSNSNGPSPTSSNNNLTNPKTPPMNRSSHSRSPPVTRTRSPLLQAGSYPNQYQQQHYNNNAQFPYDNNNHNIMTSAFHYQQQQQNNDMPLVINAQNQQQQLLHHRNLPYHPGIDNRRKNSLPVNLSSSNNILNHLNTGMGNNFGSEDRSGGISGSGTAGRFRRPSNNLPSETSTLYQNHSSPRMSERQIYSSSSSSHAAHQQHQQQEISGNRERRPSAPSGQPSINLGTHSHNISSSNTPRTTATVDVRPIPTTGPMLSSSSTSVAMTAISNNSQDAPVELDPDFIECIHDFLVSVDVQDKEEFFRLRQFLDVFLSRLSRRLSRKYPVVDCFAAAAVGARRLLSFLGCTMNANASALELCIAKALAGLLVDAKTLEDVMMRQGIDSAVRGLDDVRTRSSIDRQTIIDQIAAEYLKRADAWTPATAAKASHLRKKRGRRERFLSVFVELEEAKVALNLNEIDRQMMNNRDTYGQILQPYSTSASAQHQRYSPTGSGTTNLVQQQSSSPTFYRPSGNQFHQRSASEAFGQKQATGGYGPPYASRTSDPNIQVYPQQAAPIGSMYPFDQSGSRDNTSHYNPYLSSASQPYHQQQQLAQQHLEPPSAFNFSRQPLQHPDGSSSLNRPQFGLRKSSFTGERKSSLSATSEMVSRKMSAGSETMYHLENPVSQSSAPVSPTSASQSGRRGSAEALLQSVLDECETLIGTLHVSNPQHPQQQ